MKESSIGVGGLLLVAFIVLKLCGVINWSWWWVLAPMWIPVAILIIFLIAWFLYHGIDALIKGW